MRLQEDLTIGFREKFLDFAYLFPEYMVAQLHTLDGLVSEVSVERCQGIDFLKHVPAYLQRGVYEKVWFHRQTSRQDVVLRSDSEEEGVAQAP